MKQSKFFSSKRAVNAFQAEVEKDFSSKNTFIAFQADRTRKIFHPRIQLLILKLKQSL